MTPLSFLDLPTPALMGVLNVTPDSFSDGGKFTDAGKAVVHARQMVDEGADILDIGGESTRPGAQEVSVAEEIDRTAPVIAALRDGGIATPISIDTRKAAVAEAALQAGADIINDVSAMSFDPGLAEIAAKTGAPICLMHAQGTPETMQNDPRYANVVDEVLSYLGERVAVAIKAGIARDQIIIDPGIGFGKTLDHNLELIRNLSAFHQLECPILLGVSRKRFIGTITDVQEPADRVIGSVAVALSALSQGVQIIRAHDIKAHREGLAMWSALNGSGMSGS